MLLSPVSLLVGTSHTPGLYPPDPS